MTDAIRRRLARLEHLVRPRPRPRTRFFVCWANEVIEHGDGTYTLPDGQRTGPGDHVVALEWDNEGDHDA